MYKKFKRVGDILLAIILLLITWPLFLVIAIIIKCDSRGLVLYKQKRYNGVDTTFTIYKFRTMQMGARNKMVNGRENPRKLITRVGKVLREMHFDELPQLFNIIIGDISFIGVRPQQEHEQKIMLKAEKEWYKRFKGNVGAISIERLINIYPHTQKQFVKSLKDADYLLEKRKRLDYDLYYAYNENLYNDIIIFLYLIRTIIAKTKNIVFKREFKEYDNYDKKRRNRKLY